MSDHALTFAPMRFDKDSDEAPNIIKVVCGDQHTVVLSDDGGVRQLWGWGDNKKGQLASRAARHGERSRFLQLLLKLACTVTTVLEFWLGTFCCTTVQVFSMRI